MHMNVYNDDDDDDICVSKTSTSKQGALSEVKENEKRIGPHKNISMK